MGRLRHEQARATRARIIAAAHDLFVERGYTGTTFAAVASVAGVAVPTVYKVFGTKIALLKSVYDVTLAGDDEAVPIVQRPSAQVIAGQTDPRCAMTLYCELVTDLVSRVAPLLSGLPAATVDGTGELDAFVAAIDAERLTGDAAFAAHLADRGWLHPATDVPHARDVLFTLTSPETYRRLVLQRGWTTTDYTRWLKCTLSVLVAPTATTNPDPASDK